MPEYDLLELTEQVWLSFFIIYYVSCLGQREGYRAMLWLYIVLSLLDVYNTECDVLSITPDGPAIVRVNLFVRSIATISDIKMVSGAPKHTVQ